MAFTKGLESPKVTSLSGGSLEVGVTKIWESLKVASVSGGSLEVGVTKTWESPKTASVSDGSLEMESPKYGSHQRWLCIFWSHQNICGN